MGRVEMREQLLERIKPEDSAIGTHASGVLMKVGVVQNLT